MDENEKYPNEVEEEVDEVIEGDEESTEDNEEFTDSYEDGEDESDGDEGEAEEESTAKAQEDKSQEQNFNSYQAQKRREREAREERIKQDAYTKGMIEALGGENPYTGEKIEDASDVEEYLMMKDLERQGKDPLADFHKAVKEKSKKAAADAQEDAEIRGEIEEFTERFPDVDMRSVLTDEMFVKYAAKRVGKESLSAIYADYRAFTDEYEAKAERKAVQKQKEISARKKATPGSLKGNGGSSVTSYANMSDKAFERKLAAVLRGTEKI